MLFTREVILGAVCQHFAISADDLLSFPLPKVIQRRELAMYLMREWWGDDLLEIGKICERPDRILVRYACKKIEGELAKWTTDITAIRALCEAST